MNKLIQATRIIDGMAVLVWAVFFGIWMAGLAALNYSLIFGKPLMISTLFSVYLASFLACLFIYAFIASRIFRRMLTTHLRATVSTATAVVQWIIGIVTLMTLIIVIVWLPIALAWTVKSEIINSIFSPIFGMLGRTTTSKSLFIFAFFALPVVAIINELFVGIFLTFQTRSASGYKGPPIYSLMAAIVLLPILLKLVFRLRELRIDSDAFIFIPLLLFATCALMPFLFGACPVDRQREPVEPKRWQLDLRETFGKIRKRDFKNLSRAERLICSGLLMALLMALYLSIRSLTLSQKHAGSPIRDFIWSLREDGVWLSNFFDGVVDIVLFVDRYVGRYGADVLFWGTFAFCHVFFIYRAFRVFRERHAWPDSEKWQELDKKIRPNFNSLFDKKPMILATLVFAGCMATMIM
jgi:hypothetical protein